MTLWVAWASRSATGIGLGLDLSKKIVEVHGGSITAENNTDGKGGATIRFSIPLNLREPDIANQLGARR
jgi:signal transduction histidine kinase